MSKFLEKFRKRFKDQYAIVNKKIIECEKHYIVIDYMKNEKNIIYKNLKTEEEIKNMDCDNEEVLYSKNKDRIEKIKFALKVFKNVEDYVVPNSNMYRAIKIAEEILKEKQGL